MLTAAGVVTGRVLDFAGALMPGARVTLEDGSRRTVEADALGRFTVVGVTVVGVSVGEVLIRAVPADGVGAGESQVRLSRPGERIVIDLLVDRIVPLIYIDGPVGVVGYFDAMLEARVMDRETAVVEVQARLGNRGLAGLTREQERVSRRLEASDGLVLGENRLELTVVDQGGNRTVAESIFRVASAQWTFGFQDEGGAILSPVAILWEDLLGTHRAYVAPPWVVLLPAGPARFTFEYGLQIHSAGCRSSCGVR
jgi:hypothetical protein